MKQSVTTLLLAALNHELALSKGEITKGVKAMHDGLLDALRKKAKKGPDYLHPSPDWGQFPVARSFFTQHFN